MRFRSLALIALLTLLASCAAQEKTTAPRSAGPEAEATSEEAAGSEARATNADDEMPRVGVEDLVRGNNRFAFDVYKSLPAGNVVFSPHALVSALTNVYAGAGGETRAQMRKTLRLALADAHVHEKYRVLHDQLRGRRNLEGGQGNRGFALQVVNTVWLPERLEPTTRFLHVSEAGYLTRPERVAFRADAEAARERINSYLEQATAGSVPEILPRGAIDPLTRLLVTTTAEYRAAWAVPFARAATRDEPFVLRDGSRKPAPMMRGLGRFGYFRDDTLRILELPYEGGQVSAIILLPHEGRFAQVDASLNADQFVWWMSRLRQTPVEITLPRFAIDTREELGAALETMGMRSAFDPQAADFSGLSATAQDEDLHVSGVAHRAAIEVDEDGTRAAAPSRASAMSSGAPQPERFEARRPFIFIVRDNPTNTVLFVARVEDPS